MAEPNLFHSLDSLDDLEAALSHSEQEPVLVYKHSRTCFTSYRARQEMLTMNEPGDPPIYEVVVQQARRVSNEVAQRLGVRHQSPQLILVHHRQPLFDTSHSWIKAERIRRQLAEDPSE